jgi:hypothetical protein
MAHRGTDKKPTVVFWARFFWEGMGGPKLPGNNGLRRKKSQKRGKTQKKVQNNFRGTPDFLQNGPFFGQKRGR